MSALTPYKLALKIKANSVGLFAADSRSTVLLLPLFC